jgi:outer membrane protein assembly factor BamB
MLVVIFLFCALFPASIALVQSTDAGILRAIDIQTGRTVWELPQTGAVDSWGGRLSTAGGIVIFGDAHNTRVPGETGQLSGLSEKSDRVLERRRCTV